VHELQAHPRHQHQHHPSSSSSSLSAAAVAAAAAAAAAAAYSASGIFNSETRQLPAHTLAIAPSSPIQMPSKSKSPRAAARAAARASTTAAAAAAELEAVSKLSPEEMLVKGFGIELGDTDEATRDKGLKKMLVWLKAQQEVGEANLQKMWEYSVTSSYLQIQKLIFNV
jgi:hypothetical protein